MRGLWDSGDTMAKAAHTPSQQRLSTQSSDYAITITDCNSITKAEITSPARVAQHQVRT